MKKKTYCFFIISLIFTLKVFGLDFSAITNNLFLAVQGLRQDSTQSNRAAGVPINFDDRLCWRPFCLTGDVDLLFPKPIHGIKMRMWDAKGNEIQKTTLGSTYGSKWNQLHSYLDGYREHIGSISADKAPYKFSDNFSGQTLPRPCDLFIIDEPGIYTLEIQMQMFKNPHSSNISNWEQSLFSFPAVRVKVEKPIMKKSVQ